MHYDLCCDLSILIIDFNFFWPVNELVHFNHGSPFLLSPPPPQAINQFQMHSYAVSILFDIWGRPRSGCVNCLHRKMIADTYKLCHTSTHTHTHTHRHTHSFCTNLRRNMPSQLLRGFFGPPEFLFAFFLEHPVYIFFYSFALYIKCVYFEICCP